MRVPSQGDQGKHVVMRCSRKLVNRFGVDRPSVIHRYPCQCEFVRVEAPGIQVQVQPQISKLKNKYRSIISPPLYYSIFRFDASVLLADAGIILEYELRDRSREMKEIDLLHLCPE